MSELVAAKVAFTTTPGLEHRAVALGFRPHAVVAWWSCQAEHGSRSGNRGGIGFWTADSATAVGWRSDDGVPSIRAEQAADDAAVLGLGAAGGSPAMRAEVASFDSDGVTLRWTTPPAETWTIHALAVGGSVSSARAGWLPAETSLDSIDPDRRPDLVLLVPAPAAIAEAGDLTIGLGAASADGLAAAAYTARAGDPPGSVVARQHVGSATVGRAPRHAYLAITGIRAKVGADVSKTRPGRRRVRVGFRPDALLLFSWGLEASSDAKKMGRLCLGAIANGASGCTSWDDCNVDSETTRTHVASSAEHALLVADTQTGGVHAAATGSLGDRGFTMEWERQDGGRRQFVYVALGKPSERQRSASSSGA